MAVVYHLSRLVIDPWVCLQNGMDAYTDTDEVDEIEEDDRDRFADQLCSIGILGRLAPDHCVPLLAK